MMDPVAVGIVVLALVLIAYGCAIKWQSALVLMCAIAVSAILIWALFNDRLFPSMNGDDGLALFYFGLFIWIPAFVAAPIGAAVWIGLRGGFRGRAA